MRDEELGQNLGVLGAGQRVKRRRPHFASIERHSALTEKFDLIVASSVCNFLADYEASLRCLCSMMSPGAYFVQWDWLDDMSIDRIRGAYEATGLKAVAIEEAFAMKVDDNAMPVVMGLAQSPT